jgi:hypothetical protein
VLILQHQLFCFHELTFNLFSLNYLSIEEELRSCVTHTHNLFQADNNALFHLIDGAVLGHDVSATIAPF